MKRGVLALLPLFFALLLWCPFAGTAEAAIKDYDLSSPKDGDVDGGDLAYLIANPGPDIADFAGFLGQTYTVATRPPNILVIIGDDIGLDVTTGMYPGLITDLLALYGPPPGLNHPNYTAIDGKPASTPALDQLALQGMTFANAWAQPFCSPTRASYMTGLFAAKTNVKNYQEYLDYRHVTFVQLMKSGGYSTGAFGKWHLAGFPVNATQGMMPKKAGFELYKGGLGAAPSSYWTGYEYVVQDDTTSDTGTKPGNLQPRTLPGIGGTTGTTYSPVVQAADTIDWINSKQSQTPDKPWLAYLAFNLSHATGGTPMMVVPDKDTLDCHATDPSQDGPICKEIKGCYGGSFGGTAIGSCNGEQLMRAMTTSMDTVIGKVLAAVEAIPSDTYVIYISDNGTPMYTTGGVLGPQIGNLYITRTGRGKGSAYESGARVPLAIKGPGIAAGSRSGEFVHAADLFSTILSLAGLTPPAEVPNIGGSGTMTVDARSLDPILFGSASTVRDPNLGYTLTESENLMVSPRNIVVGARNGTYKVIAKRNTATPYNPTYEFYNLIDDPLEEYKLEGPDYIPSDCTGYLSDPEPNTADPRWNYCYLRKVIDDNSIF